METIFLSMLDKALGEIAKQELEKQVQIFTAHCVLCKPTNRSVALERNFTDAALTYLKDNCEYEGHGLASLLQANEELRD